jgi:hypothetical protein
LFVAAAAFSGAFLRRVSVLLQCMMRAQTPLAPEVMHLSVDHELEMKKPGRYPARRKL